MRLIAALVAVEAFPILGTVFFALETLLGGPGFDQRPIHGEVLVGDEGLGGFQHALKEGFRHLLVQQPIPVLGEYRGVHTRSSIPMPTNQRNNRL